MLNEVQAALHELLAARLTDAPEADATHAREALVLTLNAFGPDVASVARALASYYDDQVCSLVARLEGEDSSLLAQIRSEAFATRMINILNAIERHITALASRPNQRTEAGFLASYRRHVSDQHGKLEPPDFERRRRIPISDIYVAGNIHKITYAEPSMTPETPSPPPLDVFDLAAEIDRSVLLGDPGGGKTTAATVLMHYLATEALSRIPFLVTLREFAAVEPPERSVVGHIEHILETYYQSRLPPVL